VVNAGGTARQRESPTPLFDQLNRAVFGPSREERWAAEDAAAEQALREELEAEAEAAGGDQ
jgi:hypothetical protein